MLTKDYKQKMYRFMAQLYVSGKITQYNLINISTEIWGEPFNSTTLLKYIKEARK